MIWDKARNAARGSLGKSAIAIIPAPLPVKLERKGRLLVAVPTEGAPRLSTDTVERTRKALRKERSGASN